MPLRPADCDCPPVPLWRELVLAFASGLTVAIVREVGEGIREHLKDKREAARPKAEGK